MGKQNIQTFKVFGLNIAVTSQDGIATQIEEWVSDGKDHVVCFSDAHGAVRGHDEEPMRRALMTADIVAPDGSPLAFIGRTLYGLPVRQTCGPDFLDYMARRSQKTGVSHYFFGGKPGVAEELAYVLKQRYPGITIAGMDTPPMGVSTPEQTEAQLDRIRAAKPDIVWVGLGAPKQEIWMAENRGRLPGMTLCGIGAAFDFHTDRVKRAPDLYRKWGLEWAYRAVSEPKRLGKRYAHVVPRFIFLASRQAFEMLLRGSLRRQPVSE